MDDDNSGSNTYFYFFMFKYIRMVIFKKNDMMKNQKFCVACVGYSYPWVYGPVWPWLSICLANLAALFLRTTTKHTIAITIAITKTTPQTLKMMMHV